MTKLDDAEIEQRLTELPNWKREGNAIVRHYKASSVRTAVAVINRIADVAEGANHHPDLSWSFVNVTVSFTSHDTGGLTKRDFRVAGVVEDVLTNG